MLTTQFTHLYTPPSSTYPLPAPHFIHMHPYACMCMYVYVCVCMCMYVCACVCIPVVWPQILAIASVDCISYPFFFYFVFIIFSFILCFFCYSKIRVSSSLSQPQLVGVNSTFVDFLSKTEANELNRWINELLDDNEDYIANYDDKTHIPL